MMVYEKVLIVFTDIHLSYSPSTLNLYDELSKSFDVTILTFEPDPTFSNQIVENKNIKYLPVPQPRLAVPLVKRLFFEVEKTLFPQRIKKNLLYTDKAKSLIKEIKKFEGVFIAVDFFSLWCVQQAGKKAHFLSLEIFDDPYKSLCRVDEIQSVIIQSAERYKYLFGEKKIKTFIVQNSPNYIQIKVNEIERKKTNLIYCGSATIPFAIISYLEFIKDFPEYTLTIKGAIPINVKNIITEYFAELINDKRLIINNEYLDAEKLNEYLSTFYIGFAFYDVYRFEHINKFNYKTAPSGKLFQYYNAGIPVIANSLEAFSTIQDYKAGILIKSLSSIAIKNAIDKISSNYLAYVNGAKVASRNFDFRRMIAPFLEFIKEENNP